MFFSVLMLLVGQQKQHPDCTKYCSDNSQNLTFSRWTAQSQITLKETVITSSVRVLYTHLRSQLANPVNIIIIFYLLESCFGVVVG